MKLAGILMLAAAAVVVASPAIAQQDTTHGKMVSAVAKKGKKENLKAEAKISKDSARTIALSKVAAGSKVKSWELEREKGTVVYSFDIKVPSQPGVEEVLVSAIDGSVVSQSHESPKEEKAEAKKEKAEKAKAKKG